MEGCYQCGSEQGDVARLCPECNQMKLQSRNTPLQVQLQQEPETTRYSVGELLQFSRAGVLKGAAAILVISAFLLLNIRTLQRYFAADTPEELYRQCTEHLGENIPEEGDLLSVGSMAAARVVAEVCERIQSACESEPEGQICTRAKAGMKQLTQTR